MTFVSINLVPLVLRKYLNAGKFDHISSKQAQEASATWQGH
jgi:hypothetical protein